MIAAAQGVNVPGRLTRSVPSHAGSVEFCVAGGRQIAKAAVWPDGVVVVLPGRQIEPGVGQRGEQGLVEQFVP